MKVLIVDDSILTRQMLKDLLSDLGHEISGLAEDGEEGFNKYKELNPDLVILDIAMPKMNGLDCLKVIKEYDVNAKVIICSSFGQKQIIIEAMELGAESYIIKPVNEKELVKTLNKIETN